MIELKESSKRVVRREVFEFDEPYGSWEADTWTRVEVDGELSQWIPHDGYGEMARPTSASPSIRETLEQKYQQSAYV